MTAKKRQQAKLLCRQTNNLSLFKLLTSSGCGACWNVQPGTICENCRKLFEDPDDN